MPRTTDTLDNVLDEHDAALAQAAQRCLITALDHSRAAKIRLVADGKDMPSVELPPKAVFIGLSPRSEVRAASLRRGMRGVVRW